MTQREFERKEVDRVARILWSSLASKDESLAPYDDAPLFIQLKFRNRARRMVAAGIVTLEGIKEACS